MRVCELTQEECGAALARVSFGRLACSRDNQPYVLPISFSYDGTYLYAVGNLGQKIDWMRANPLVCLEVDERHSQHEWMSVVVTGRYEELTDTHQFGDERAHALEVLQKRPMWWEPAFVSTHAGAAPATPIYYRIHIKQMSGRRATRDAVEADASAPATAAERWLGSILRHWNRASAFIIFEPHQTETYALVKLPRTDQTDALLRGGDLHFSYDRLHGRYRLRLGEDDLDRSSHLLSALMKQAQHPGAA